MTAPFDPSVLAADPVRRSIVLELLAAGLAAAEPGAAVRRSLSRAGQVLSVGERRFELRAFGGIRVLGLGKASVAMATAVESILSDRPLTGVVVAPEPGVIRGIDVLTGSHPIPDESSMAGGQALSAAARTVRENELLFVLISGGGSALTAVPPVGVPRKEVIAVTEALLRSGASIGEMNTVRKQLSAISGGRLIEAAGKAAAVITLVLSDVVGSPIDTVASGPTVPDPTGPGEALAVLDRYGLTATSAPVAEFLQSQSVEAGGPVDRSHPVYGRQVIEVVGDASTAANAVAAKAVSMGIPNRVAATDLVGEARQVAREILARARTSFGVDIYAGETTVTVVGGGRGGRNQELALAAGLDLSGEMDLVVASFGTDGVDGPTVAAGAIGDEGTIRRAEQAGLDADEALAANDSFTLLSATNDLLLTGPTGTNVGDLVLVLNSRGIKGI